LAIQRGDTAFWLVSEADILEADISQPGSCRSGPPDEDAGPESRARLVSQTRIPKAHQWRWMHRDHAPDGISLTLSIGRRWRVCSPLQRSRAIWLGTRPVEHTGLIISALYCRQ
jgi:hypothetical protein